MEISKLPPRFENRQMWENQPKIPAPWHHCGWGDSFLSSLSDLLKTLLKFLAFFVGFIAIEIHKLHANERVNYSTARDLLF